MMENFDRCAAVWNISNKTLYLKYIYCIYIYYTYTKYFTSFFCVDKDTTLKIQVWDLIMENFERCTAVWNILTKTKHYIWFFCVDKNTTHENNNKVVKFRF